MKGESIPEIAAAASVMRKLAAGVDIMGLDNVSISLVRAAMHQAPSTSQPHPCLWLPQPDVT